VNVLGVLVAVGYVTVCVALLAGDGVLSLGAYLAVLAAGSLAAGAVLARWWAVLLALPVLIGWLLLASEGEGEADLELAAGYAIALAAVAALLLAAGVAVGRLRRS
jgi:hypothetical protein